MSYSPGTTAVLCVAGRGVRMVRYLRAVIEGRRNDDERFLLTFSSLALGPTLSRTCPAIVPQFFTTWAHQAQYATHAHAFLLSFFVTVENKRLVKPTPNRKVARSNRRGAPKIPVRSRRLVLTVRMPQRRLLMSIRE